MSSRVDMRSAAPANITKLLVYSNEDPSKSVNLSGGTIRLLYYESILQDTVRVSLTYSDAGDTIKKGDKRVTAIEGLPMVGQEQVELVFVDNNKNEISFTQADNNPLYINKITPILDDTTRSLVSLDLVSKEFILNEKIRVNTRFAGKISEHVKGILTQTKVSKDGDKEKTNKDYLNTKKEIDVEDTA